MILLLLGMHCLKGSIGRTDLHTGDMQQLLHSITTYLFTLPEEFPVYQAMVMPRPFNMKKPQTHF